VENKILELIYHPIETLVADRLTKAILNPKFNQFIKDLGLREPKEVKYALEN
jgi:hypothetical protein